MSEKWTNSEPLEEESHNTLPEDRYMEVNNPLSIDNYEQDIEINNERRVLRDLTNDIKTHEKSYTNLNKYNNDPNNCSLSTNNAKVSSNLYNLDMSAIPDHHNISKNENMNNESMFLEKETVRLRGVEEILMTDRNVYFITSNSLKWF